MYAILRFAKYKGPELGRIEAHNERAKERYASNPDVDTSRSHLNVHLVEPRGHYRAEAERQIAQAGCRTRSDSVRLVETLMTGSPELFRGKTPQEICAYFHHALDFLTQRQRPETILSAVIHLDEKTPHMHVTFVPLTADNRLSAKEIIGNRKQLIQWQDDFYRHMTRQYPQLERGESAAETGRDHIPPRVFKQMARLNKQKECLEVLPDGVNLLNYKARAQQIGEVLDRYLPDVAKMRAQLKRYNIAFTDTMAENQALKDENAQLNARLEQTQQRNFAKQLEDAKLRKDYAAALRVLERIPREVLDTYAGREARESARSRTGKNHQER